MTQGEGQGCPRQRGTCGEPAACGTAQAPMQALFEGPAVPGQWVQVPLPSLLLFDLRLCSASSYKPLYSHCRRFHLESASACRRLFSLLLAVPPCPGGDALPLPSVSRCLPLTPCSHCSCR